MYSFIVVAIVSAIFLYFKPKACSWPDALSTVGLSFLLTFLVLLILTVIITTPVVTEYPLVKFNDVYFTKTSDKYGTTYYTYAYQTPDELITRSTTHFKLSNTYKVEIITDHSLLGNWGLTFLSNTIKEYNVHIPKQNIEW